MKDWRDAWAPFEGVTYLNAAGQAPLPRVAVQAAERALQYKTYPHLLEESTYFEASDRTRRALASLVGGRPEEIALTTGAGAGAAAVAYGLQWRPGDEVITAAGEFPIQFTAWKPLEQREGVVLKVVQPNESFIAAEDLIAALTPRTRLVSVSLVRFDDGSLLNARKVADACHAQGALLFLDVSQCCGALDLNAEAVGADFMTCAGYKWLLSPYGTGFFWIKLEHLDLMRAGPFGWMSVEGAEIFSALNFSDPRPGRNARRWDAAEWASYYNLNLATMAASVEFLLEAGPQSIGAHNRALIDRLFAGLGEGCVPASPLDAARRGPYGCFRGQSTEQTPELYQRLQAQRVVVSLREGNIRVSPHLFNTAHDIDRLLAVLQNRDV